MIDPFDHPEFQFDAENHLYTYDGELCFTSTTEYIEKWITPFDEEKWSKIKADEMSVPVEKILDMWRTKRDKAGVIGTSVHRQIEEFLIGEGVRMSSHPISVLKYARWLEWWLRIHKYYDVQIIEWRMFNLAWGLSGTADLLIKTKLGLVLLDWKTNEKMRTHGGFGFLLPPFDSFPENDLTKYSLQLSMYRAMAMRAGIDIKKGYLVHIEEEGVSVHECFDFRDQIIEVMK